MTRAKPSRREAPPDTGRPILYSKTCQYALRAMERVAAAERKDPDAWVPQQWLADELEIPLASLAQVVHRLRKAGLLTARRGPSGGVGLSRPSREIRVLDIIRAIDGQGLGDRCVLGFAVCSDAVPCPAHHVWSGVREKLDVELEHRSLQDMLDVVEKRAKGLVPKTRRSS